ncbi:Protoheme IX farnesyltransferase, mitochondrial [Spiromyces aspiralis]|uniref:Protoheme IX farnesyltransferase, mitochondrial n=1 Tax=Spiromyces aspiralis TaxID=68401 RepID=A0ACC1HQ37_9FUNG|nr:Protoheme IX farnesyltransferase, mitochondrial [Spiromyces aspiralis]
MPPAKKVKVYQDMMKGKLSAFVVLTAMAGYAAAPISADLTTLLWTTLGTSLCSASANSINQWIEIPYDAQMNRTRNRPLVRHALRPVDAFLFGSVTGAFGVATLMTMVNPLTGWLGLSNIVLYTLVYTPLKRITILNTWVGAVVGAIPPLMGWAAATGTLDPGAWVLGCILFAWQFPHFNSLAWTLRADYSKAGYFMAPVTNPRLNARVSLRYSLLMFPLCATLVYLDMTDQWFLLDSSMVNGYLLYCAYKFWRNSSDKTSRPLFFSSIVHLPLLVILILIHKRQRRSQQDLETSASGNSSGGASSGGSCGARAVES